MFVIKVSETDGFIPAGDFTGETRIMSEMALFGSKRDAEKFISRESDRIGWIVTDDEYEIVDLALEPTPVMVEIKMKSGEYCLAMRRYA